MKRIFVGALCMGAVLVFWFSGCSNPAGPIGTSLSSADQTAINNLISSDALFTNDAAIMNDGSPSSTLAKSTTAINVIAWGRKIDWSMVSRNVSYDQVDSVTVVATITNTWGGNIWIREARPDSMGDTTIYKPFTESSVRKVKFTKMADSISMHHGMNWKMRQVSAMQGGTTSSHGITIEKVDFYVGTDTIEVTDPLNFYLQQGVKGHHCLEELPESMEEAFKVQVTVNSTDPDSDLVTARRPVVFNNAWSYRAPMKLVSSVSNGNGTYTRVYESSWHGAWAGRHNVMVGAVPRSAVFDDSTQFSSQIWGIPYIVD
jgi:hypothetical protein